MAKWKYIRCISIREPRYEKLYEGTKTRLLRRYNCRCFFVQTRANGSNTKIYKNKLNPEHSEYTHPSLEPILNVTYGCMVYQEQVMQIVRDLAGYSLGRADLVRRAMGKKN